MPDDMGICRKCCNRRQPRQPSSFVFADNSTKAGCGFHNPVFGNMKVVLLGESIQLSFANRSVPYAWRSFVMQGNERIEVGRAARRQKTCGESNR